jgi:hypothetical protein
MMPKQPGLASVRPERLEHLVIAPAMKVDHAQLVALADDGELFADVSDITSASIRKTKHQS